MTTETRCYVTKARNGLYRVTVASKEFPSVRESGAHGWGHAVRARQEEEAGCIARVAARVAAIKARQA